MSRYQKMFDRLESENAIAFVPFVTLGDPNIEISFEIIKNLIDSGADALELGFPFSDPIADGPTIQAAALRALNANTSIDDCFTLLEKVRQYNDSIPIGLLLYSNLVFRPGLDIFYNRLRQAGVDSLLIADVPLLEIQPFIELANDNGIEQVLILPPDASDEVLQQVARLSQGYVYLLSRAGVTGAETVANIPKELVIEKLRLAGSAPPVLGFGISQPEQVSEAKRAGAGGAISGSAIVKIIEQHANDTSLLCASITEFVKKMKAATQ